MMKNRHQYALGAFFATISTVFFVQSISLTANASSQSNFIPTAEQKMTARQVANFLDKAHYLDQPLDAKMGKTILKFYIDNLDPNHTLFLQSDIDEFYQNYGNNFAQKLKSGDLSAGIDIFERYRTRSNEYYAFAKTLLTTQSLNLNTDQSIILDREKLSHFHTKQEQQNYWKNQTLYALIAMTLAQEGDKAKDQAFLENPKLSRGQDLVKAESRTPSQILLNRITRQEAQLARLKDDEIMESILNSAMQAYDPHSNYFAPVQANEMQIQSNLELEGIGVSIRPDRKNPDYTRIITLVDGGPAAKTGQIRSNDVILGVAQDGQEMVDTVGFSTREIVALIRGKRGTSVVLKVKQPNDPDSSARIVTIVRDVITQEESGVHQRVINLTHNGMQKRVGVLEIPSFYLNFQARRSGQSDYRSVSADTEKALIALNQQNIDGLVVDLRGNPGGSLDEVAKMLGLFIKSGPLVQIRDNQGNVIVYADNDGGKQLYKGEMVVIVDLASASASEIFAAAIQDYGRGLVVGSTTTGKGSAQVQLDDLPLGSVTLTQRKFYRITGGSTQNKGVVPDISFVNIYENANFGEREYKNPLPWDTIKTAPYLPEGKYSKPLIRAVSDISQKRQANNADFVYLTKLNKIRHRDDDKNPKAVNLLKRKQLNNEMEQATLTAENVRRQAKGELPYTNWATYQASLDALYEEWGRLKEHERPKLPEAEAYVQEAAYVMFDAQKLAKNSK